MVPFSTWVNQLSVVFPHSFLSAEASHLLGNEYVASELNNYSYTIQNTPLELLYLDIFGYDSVNKQAEERNLPMFLY